MTLFDLEEDRGLTFRLFLTCLGTALVITSLYTLVAYRFGLELGRQTQSYNLSLQAEMILNEILEGDSSVENARRMVENAYTPEKGTSAFYLDVIEGSGNRWQINNNFNPQAARLLTEQTGESISFPDNFASTGHFRQASNDYYWSVLTHDNTTIILSVIPNHIGNLLGYLTTRLGVSSIIVFWLTAWLAIYLARTFSERIYKKNKALKMLATHDNLTGLPNRLYLMDHLAKFTAEHRDKGTTGALFLIDLDHFKEINDTLGQEAGDTLLRHIANSLQSSVPEKQLLARTGGDEFMIWVSGIQAEDAECLADKILEVCHKPVNILNLNISIASSIGIALYPQHSHKSQTLIAYADKAMNEAKSTRCGWAMYTQSSTSATNEIFSIQVRSEIGNALQEKQIELYYQPKVDLATGQICSAEALARWAHPSKGLLPPGLFIPLIEESGWILEFGRYVISAAVTQLAAWKRHGIHIPVAINLHPYNLLDTDIVSYTRETLEKYDVPTELLEIELTESFFSLHIDSISKTLESFRAMGIRISIDDFGTGMSSLSYINKLFVDTIKIDKSFTFTMHENPANRTIVSTAIKLAHAFGSKAIAEGVETPEQEAMLRKLGCDQAQGYLYAAPLPAQDFLAMYKSKMSSKTSNSELNIVSFKNAITV
jgi:diguanylate cyclase (GGDEF)-like protein